MGGEARRVGGRDEGANGGRGRNQSPPPAAAPPTPPSLFPLIISGSASVLVLDYFHAFSHFHENNRETNRHARVSEYNQA